jgi:hypothetical protein
VKEKSQVPYLENVKANVSTLVNVRVENWSHKLDRGRQKRIFWRKVERKLKSHGIVHLFNAKFNQIVFVFGGWWLVFGVWCLGERRDKIEKLNFIGVDSARERRQTPLLGPWMTALHWKMLSS